jgi:translocation and assembly module TamB
MGGQLITLKGRANLPAGESPQLDFSLSGENLPFVRQAGLLVRGDLDLKLRSNERSTTVDGDVRLRDSLFLTDLTSFVPTGAKGSMRRPPYFSIDAAPLNRWRLNVNVKGQRFLRLRTPVFHGVASARLNLSGTLENPRAAGEATIDEGTVRLPFATFEVKQGQVSLSPDQPEPQLLVNATTRRYGYDLRLDVTGAASTPNVTFSSSPPLESEQVLLMVMAGEAPHNEVATTDRQRATRFGAFFGQSLLGTLSGDAGGADRLTISSGEDISQQGRETYTIEYKLNDKWALTGEYDEFDEYYGGLKWRFYQKGGKPPRAD